MSDLKEILQENSYMRQQQLIFADCDRYQRARVSTLLSIAAAVAGADYDARGLTYIDYNLDPAGMLGLDWATDTPDSGSHLNVLGAIKLTDVLGEYLTRNYDLPDHRGEAGFEHWDDDARTWTDTMDKAIPNAMQAAGLTQ